MSHMSIAATMKPRFEEILTAEALAFITELHDLYAGTRGDLLNHRQVNRTHYSNGRRPTFAAATAHIREDATWSVAGAGPGMADRRVEITGPAEPKMACNALNSDAQVWLADLEDATSPTWDNVIGSQLTLFDAIRRQLVFDSNGKLYTITKEVTPTIMMRPRGLHMTDRHIMYVDALGRRQPGIAALIDFGLHFFHNAKELIAQGAGPYFYLPKLESHLEAQLWNNIFTFAEERMDIPYGTIRATVLIETIPAAFEMEEILWELRDHCAGLNAGRWDYIFSIIKNFRESGHRFITPDRDQITMNVPFMRAYTELLVSTCHKRGAHAIGGMSASVPNKNDPEFTANALAAIAADKKREATDGFDGTWVAHPGLIPTARAEFDAVLGDRPHQLDNLRDDVVVEAAELLDIKSFEGVVTDNGVFHNVSIAIRYVEAWLRGYGAVALDGLMEDTATAEISRSQIWHWINHDVVTQDGTRITGTLIEQMIDQVLSSVSRSDDDRFDDAVHVFKQVCLDPDHFPPFLTLSAYSQFLATQ